MNRRTMEAKVVASVMNGVRIFFFVLAALFLCVLFTGQVYKRGPGHTTHFRFLKDRSTRTAHLRLVKHHAGGAALFCQMDRLLSTERSGWLNPPGSMLHSHSTSRILHSKRAPNSLFQSLLSALTKEATWAVSIILVCIVRSPERHASSCFRESAYGHEKK